MDESRVAAAECADKFADHYLRFLNETSMIDGAISRTLFYDIAMRALEELPLPDARAQKLAMEYLRNSRMSALRQVMDEAMNRPTV